MNRIQKLQNIANEMAEELGANCFTLGEIEEKAADFQLYWSIKNYIEENS